MITSYAAIVYFSPSALYQLTSELKTSSLIFLLLRVMAPDLFWLFCQMELVSKLLNVKQRHWHAFSSDTQHPSTRRWHNVTSCRSAIFCCRSILIVYSSSHLNDRTTREVQELGTKHTDGENNKQATADNVNQSAAFLNVTHIGRGKLQPQCSLTMQNVAARQGV